MFGKLPPTGPVHRLSDGITKFDLPPEGGCVKDATALAEQKAVHHVELKKICHFVFIEVSHMQTNAVPVGLVHFSSPTPYCGPLLFSAVDSDYQRLGHNMEVDYTTLLSTVLTRKKILNNHFLSF